MKKGQNNKALSPDKTWAENLDVAMWGRFAGTKALEAYDAVVFGLHNWEGAPPNAALIDAANALDYFKNAIARKDAQFFRDLAEMVELIDSNGFAHVSPEYAEAIAFYNVQKLRAASGKRPAKITREEIRDHLSRVYPDGINDLQVYRIMKATGMKLERGKPGPKAIKKKTAGKGRA